MALAVSHKGIRGMGGSEEDVVYRRDAQVRVVSPEDEVGEGGCESNKGKETLCCV